MKGFTKAIEKISSLLDDIAGWIIVATMSLVVINVILRSLFKSPIKGIYEYSGYLTALIIAFSIGKCAVEKAHIAVDFLVEKLNPKLQHVIDTVFGIITAVFLVFSGIYVFYYGITVLKNGEVSQTAHIPIYPFIFMVSAGLFVLCLVEISKLIKGVSGK